MKNSDIAYILRRSANRLTLLEFTFAERMVKASQGGGHREATFTSAESDHLSITNLSHRKANADEINWLREAARPSMTSEGKQNLSKKLAPWRFSKMLGHQICMMSDLL